MQWFTLLTNFTLSIFIGFGAYYLGRSDENRRWKKEESDFWYETLLKYKSLNNIPYIIDNMKWECKVCEDMRLDKFISVVTHDMSKFHGFPPGTYFLNVKYCNDNLECKNYASNVNNWTHLT